MFNSGLIGVSPVHIPLMEDTLAYIDALIGRARKFPTLEQLALSEVARLSLTADCRSARQLFLHYWQGAAAPLYGEQNPEKACRRTGMI